MVVITNPDACVAGQTYRECPTTAFDADNYYSIQNGIVTDDYIEYSETTSGSMYICLRPGSSFKRYANLVHIDNRVDAGGAGFVTVGLYGTMMTSASNVPYAGLGIYIFNYNNHGDMVIRKYQDSQGPDPGFDTVGIATGCFDLFMSTVITFLPYDGTQHPTIFELKLYNGVDDLRFSYSMLYNFKITTMYTGQLYKNIPTFSIPGEDRVNDASKIVYEYLQCTSGLPESCRASIYADFDYEVL